MMKYDDFELSLLEIPFRFQEVKFETLARRKDFRQNFSVQTREEKKSLPQERNLLQPNLKVFVDRLLKRFARPPPNSLKYSRCNVINSNYFGAFSHRFDRRKASKANSKAEKVYVAAAGGGRKVLMDYL